MRSPGDKQGLMQAQGTNGHFNGSLWISQGKVEEGREGSFWCVRLADFRVSTSSLLAVATHPSWLTRKFASSQLMLEVARVYVCVSIAKAKQIPKGRR